MTLADLSIPLCLIILLTFLQSLIPSIMTWNFAKYEDGTDATNKDGMGPRDRMPVTSVMVGRVERAKANLFESLIMLFPALALAVQAGPTSTTMVGLWLFLGARLIYIPCYVFAILYVRSAAWSAGLISIVIVWMSGLR